MVSIGHATVRKRIPAKIPIWTMLFSVIDTELARFGRRAKPISQRKMCSSKATDDWTDSLQLILQPW